MAYPIEMTDRAPLRRPMILSRLDRAAASFSVAVASPGSAGRWPTSARSRELEGALDGDEGDLRRFPGRLALPLMLKR